MINYEEIEIPIKNGFLSGNLTIPPGAKGIVLFAHGSGSSRLSPRNQYVANILSKNQIATLLFDLLTKEEERVDDLTAELRFNIPLLAERLKEATKWVQKNSKTKDLPIGFFGASTGSAAALIAAAHEERVKAVVSRGGRPDLAGKILPLVKAPTLLIVGGDDLVVIDLNEQALKELKCEKKLVIVPHATHLFEEEGALEKVADIAAAWFKKFF